MPHSGKGRRTLAKVGTTPTPQQLYEQLMASKGWPYKANQEWFLTRDRALVSVMYNGELRVSETIRVKLGQFEDTEEALIIHDVLLSKTRKKMVFGSNARYREVKLPKNGERACFTLLIQKYLDLMKSEKKTSEDRLFPFSLNIKKTQVGIYKWRDKKTETPLYSVQLVGTHRAWQIVNALLPNITQHWLRVFGEKWLYKKLDKDIIAVAKIVKVDPRTAIKYLMAGDEEYPIV